MGGQTEAVCRRAVHTWVGSSLPNHSGAGIMFTACLLRFGRKQELKFESPQYASGFGLRLSTLPRAAVAPLPGLSNIHLLSVKICI